MPQLIDLPSKLPQPGAGKLGRLQPQAPARREQPVTKFKDAIEQSRRQQRQEKPAEAAPPPKDEQPERAETPEAPQKPQKAVAKKAARKDADDADRPEDSAAPVDTAETAEAKPVESLADATDQDDNADGESAVADEAKSACDAAPEATDAATAAALALSGGQHPQQQAAQAEDDAPQGDSEAESAAVTAAVTPGTAASADLHAKPAVPTSAKPAHLGEATQSADHDAEPAEETPGAFQLPSAQWQATADADPDGDPAIAATTPGTPHAADTSDAADADLTLPTPVESKSTPFAPPTAQPAVKEAVAPEQRFVERNGDKIVQSIRGDLMPTGGTMKIRLDPPNLGQLHIDVTVDRDGSISAAFQTTNDDATALLSHSMQHLKTAIESTGVAVDRIQVKQASAGEQSSSSNQQDGHDRDNPNQQDHPARQEQQRREMIQRMWARLAGTSDDLDLVA